MSAAQVEAIGPLPRTHGLLGAMLNETAAYRTSNIRKDPRFQWWPPPHPRMSSFLGVPIVAKGNVIAAFYMTDKIGADEFSDDDQAAVEMLAAHAAIAIENARLFERSRELSVVEERTRLARELHDSVSQTLFSMSLVADAAATLVDRDTAKAKTQLEGLREMARAATQEMRSLIFELRPADLDAEGLVATLRKHIDVLRRVYPMRIEFKENVAARPPPAVEREVYRLAQEAFYDNPNALRDYFRDIGRMVLAAEGRKANDSHADCYQYFCLPEYGTANGRLHFHAVHFMRTLPTGSVDPNFGRRVRNRRQLNSLQNTWPYGYSMPIAVRYTQDAFSRSGWLWPVDAKGEPLKATSYMAVGFYVAKYVNKKSDMDLAAKGLGAKEWNNSLKTKLSLLPKKLFRIRMSRNFGMKMLTMTNLSTECLIQLTKLGYDATPLNQILKQNAKREMRLRLGKVTVADVLAAQPVTTNLLKFMRASIKMIGVSNLQSFIASMTQKLTLSDISDESKNYLDKAGITTACLRIKSKWTAGGK